MDILNLKSSDWDVGQVSNDGRGPEQESLFGLQGRQFPMRTLL